MLEVLEHPVDLKELVDDPLVRRKADPLRALRIREQAVDRGTDRREVRRVVTSIPLSPSTI